MTKIYYLLPILILAQACFPVSVYKTIYQASNNQINSGKFEITTAIKNLPFAMQIVEHQNVSSLMVLGYDDYEDRLSFIDADEKIFTLFHGKVISSNNFENNLEIKNPPNIKDIFFNLVAKEKNQISHEALIRFTNPKTSYLSIKIEYTILPKQQNLYQTKINGEKLEYYILEEGFQVSEIYWQGKNTYWISENGDILKSKQIVFPNKPKYYFETLKMYSKD